MDEGAQYFSRYRDGDEAALDELIRLLRPPLEAFLRRYLPSREDVEEVAADAFVELIRHPERYNGSVTLKTYLFSVARNRAIDRVRREARRVTLPWEAAATVPSDATPEAALLRKEHQQECREAFAALKDDYRMALYLTTVEGMTYEEAGKVMKKSRKQIENLVTRGRAALRNRVKEE